MLLCLVSFFFLHHFMCNSFNSFQQRIKDKVIVHFFSSDVCPSYIKYGYKYLSLLLEREYCDLVTKFVRTFLVKGHTTMCEIDVNNNMDPFRIYDDFFCVF